MIAAGPFTTDNSVSFIGLKDLFDVVLRDQPQVIILLGPFLDTQN